MDKIIECPLEDLKLVLSDWEEIRKNYKKISIDILSNYFTEHPSYKNLFPALIDVSEEDLVHDEYVRIQYYYLVLFCAANYGYII